MSLSTNSVYNPVGSEDSFPTTSMWADQNIESFQTLFDILLSHGVHRLFVIHVIHELPKLAEGQSIIHGTVTSNDSYGGFYIARPDDPSQLRGYKFKASPDGTMNAYEYTTHPVADISDYESFAEAFSNAAFELGVQGLFGLTAIREALDGIRQPSTIGTITDSSRMYREALDVAKGTNQTANDVVLKAPVKTTESSQVTHNTNEEGLPPMELIIYADVPCPGCVGGDRTNSPNNTKGPGEDIPDLDKNTRHNGEAAKYTDKGTQHDLSAIYSDPKENSKPEPLSVKSTEKKGAVTINGQPLPEGWTIVMNPPSVSGQSVENDFVVDINGELLPDGWTFVLKPPAGETPIAIASP
ncbi:hypothetical protein GGS20DRAFT_164104 [Poronia punctata]|nr:hypothetical protein GGS20DRAFT_164104 [Poronia punctata]